MINILFFAFLILSFQVHAMNMHVGPSSPDPLNTLEKVMKAKVEAGQRLYQEMAQLRNMRSRLFDQALIKDNVSAACDLLKEESTSIGLWSMYKTRDYFAQATWIMKENVVYSIADKEHQSENRKRLLWILASLGDVEFTKSFFKKLPKDKHRKYLNIPVWSDDGIVVGYTPLYIAAEKLHLELAKYLLEEGADGSLHPQGNRTVKEILSPFGIEIKPVQLSEHDFTTI